MAISYGISSYLVGNVLGFCHRNISCFLLLLFLKTKAWGSNCITVTVAPPSDNSATFGRRPCLVPWPSFRHHQAETLGNCTKTADRCHAGICYRFVCCFYFNLLQTRSLHVIIHYFQLVESFSTHYDAFGVFSHIRDRGTRMTTTR